jgi:hypothetical protein
LDAVTIRFLTASTFVPTADLNWKRFTTKRVYTPKTLKLTGIVRINEDAKKTYPQNSLNFMIY